MRKFICVCAALIAAALFLAGCTATDNAAAKELNVIATIFPAYDLAKHAAGDTANVSMLLPPGTESHSYEPTAKDIIAIRECDVFICNGGESDEWVESLLESMEGETDRPKVVIKMMELVQLKEETLTEGMQAEHEHEKEYDEHVWTSPKNAMLILDGIRSSLISLTDDEAVISAINASADGYMSELEKLDADFAEFFKGDAKKLMVFGDRFPFRYFADEYGLECYAAFPGCAAETEPSAATIAFLIDKVRQNNVKTVFTIEFSNATVAKAISEETGCEVKLFHSCHNVSSDELAAGASYVSLMRANLETLKNSY